MIFCLNTILWIPPQELEGDFVTDCLYKMEDADGFMGINHTFEINGSFNDADYFNFIFYQAIDTYTREYVLKWVLH